MSETINLFLLALLGSIIALVGGIVFLFNKKWSKTLEDNSIPFAAGVLITVSLMGLLPEAVEIYGENSFLVMVVAFFGAYLFENILFVIHHHEFHEHDYESFTPLVILGDTIHNFIDGVAIGASFLIAPGLGLITAISTFLHEVPHEIGDFGILLKAGWKRKDILIVNAFSASTTIIGAFLIFFFTENTSFIGVLLAISAGIFLYLGASDFLPHVVETREKRIKGVLPLVIGVLAMLVTLMAVPHSHEETEKELLNQTREANFEEQNKDVQIHLEE